MKVLFINPPYEHTVGRFKKLAHHAEPPLGLAYLAGFIRSKFPEVTVDILDAAAFAMDFDEIVSFIKGARPDVLALTSVTMTANSVKKIARTARQILPGTLFVAGGIHPTVLPDEFFPDVDICVLGEGEFTLADILKAHSDGTDFSVIPGVALLRDGRCLITGERPFIEDLDSLPMPAWNLLPLDRYVYQYPHRTSTRRFASVFTSRGCPHNCTFCCSKHVWKRKVRFRSVENIIREIRDLRERFQVSLIHFADDTFSLDRERTIALLKRIMAEKIDIRWSCLTRVDALDEELLLLMKKSGCADLQIGVESGDPDILKSLDKKITLEQVRETFRLVKKTGLRCKGTFMIGNRGETPETIRKTIALALELNPTLAAIAIMVPFPGTALFDEYHAKKQILTYDWDKYHVYKEPVFFTETLSREDIIALYREANRRFYLRPGKIFSYARDTLRSGRYDILMHSFWNTMNKISG
ncbi:MAG: radical SAM protein [bacterium]